MLFARHFPEQRFSAAEFNAMPVLDPNDDAQLPAAGFYRMRDARGKAIVFSYPDWIGDLDIPLGSGWYAVRPVVRVPAGSRPLR